MICTQDDRMFDGIPLTLSGKRKSTSCLFTILLIVIEKSIRNRCEFPEIIVFPPIGENLIVFLLIICF